MADNRRTEPQAHHNTKPGTRHPEARRHDPAVGGTTHPGPVPDEGAGGSMLRAGVIMAVLGVLLSWLPLIGPAIAGAVGGREAGTPSRALLVALLPALLLAVLVGWILTAFELPILGTVAGIGVFIALVVQLAPLLLGAWLGASMTAETP